MFEPFKPFAPLSGIARQPSYQLTPEEESNLLASIGGGLLSGVGWLGETLGKGGGGRAGRGVGLLRRSQGIRRRIAQSYAIVGYSRHNPF